MIVKAAFRFCPGVSVPHFLHGELHIVNMYVNMPVNNLHMCHIMDWMIGWDGFRARLNEAWGLADNHMQKT